jgi:hypothetical protein
LIADVPFYICDAPIVHLKESTFSKQRKGWEESPKPTLRKKDQRKLLLAYGESAIGLLLSHDCEIDKPNARRLLLAPVRDISDLSEELQTAILDQRQHSQLPLPDVPDCGHMYADLRHSTAIPRSLIDVKARLCSMTTEARQRLQMQIVAFYTRLADADR